MADPLSIASGVAGLITLAEVVISRTCSFIKTCRNASKDASRMFREVHTLLDLLHGLQRLRSQIDVAQLESQISLEQIQHCQRTLVNIQKKLSKADPKDGSSIASKAVRTAKWPFTSEEMDHIMEDFNHYKATFDLTLSMDILEATLLASTPLNDIAIDVKDIKEDITRIELTKEKKKALDFFTTVGNLSNHQANLEIMQPGTGTWLAKESAFTSWHQTKGSKLWLHGIPGAGKSIMCALAIEHVRQRLPSSAALAYFYCDYKDPKAQGLSNLLATVSAQLALQNERCCRLLQKSYKDAVRSSGKSGLPSLMVLRDLVRSMSGSFDSIYMIIDGMDESDDPSGMALALSELTDEIECHLLLASRDEYGVASQLKDVPQIEIAARSEDLQLYVAAELEIRTRKNMLRIGSVGLKEIILDRLVKEAAGMFRWVSCQIDLICELPDDATRREALDQLPKGLYETYQRILSRVSRKSEKTQSMVQKVLWWLISDHEEDKRLSIDQLREALAIRPNTRILDREACPQLEDIIFHCSSLVRLNADRTAIEPAHFTVEQFLRSIDTSQPAPWARYAYVQATAENLKLESCLTYLLYDHFNVPKSTSLEEENRRLDGHAFYRYAVWTWPVFADATTLSVAGTTLLKKLFSSPRSHAFILWTRTLGMILKTVDDPDVSAERSRLEFLRQTALATKLPLLGYACIVGASTLVKEYLTDSAVNEEMDFSGTPLICTTLGLAILGSWKSESGPSLIKNNSLVGSDQESDEDEDEVEIKPFHSEYSQQRRQVVDCLFEYEVSMPKGSGDADGALITAIDSGFADLLLNKGWPLNDSVFRWFISEPPEGKDLAVALQQRISDLQAEEIQALDSTLLEELCQQWGFTNPHILPEPLNQPALTNLEDHADLRALFIEACDTDDAALVEQLLDLFSFEASDSDDDGQTLLHLAASKLAPLAVKRLIARGFDVNAVDGNGCPPLHQLLTGTWEAQKLEILETLLTNGANVDGALCSKGDTAFHLCAMSGNPDAIALLFQRGANHMRQDAAGQTIWHMFAANDDLEAFETARQALSEEDIAEALMIPDDGGLLPFHVAAASGSADLFPELHQHTRDALARDREGRGVSHHAIRGLTGSTGPLQFLLDQEFEFSADAYDGSTVLHELVSLLSTRHPSRWTKKSDRLERAIDLLMRCGRSLIERQNETGSPLQQLSLLVAASSCSLKWMTCASCTTIHNCFNVFLELGADPLQSTTSVDSSIEILFRKAMDDGLSCHALVYDLFIMILDTVSVKDVCGLMVKPRAGEPKVPLGPALMDLCIKFANPLASQLGDAGSHLYSNVSCGLYPTLTRRRSAGF